jgi:hypothetical protein
MIDKEVEAGEGERLAAYSPEQTLLDGARDQPPVFAIHPTVGQASAT